MGRVVAEALEGQLDVVLVRKLSAPGNSELAIGSIDETGAVYLESETRHLFGEAYLEKEEKAQLSLLHLRRQQYETAGPSIEIADRIAIVLDDGIATGATMLAALSSVRARHPRKLIAAAGVASPEALELLQPEADEVVCLEVPPVLYAVGYYFNDFAPVSDEEVLAILRECRHSRVNGGPTQVAP
jgi:predicted phosphoribosyltransferase